MATEHDREYIRKYLERKRIEGRMYIAKNVGTECVKCGSVENLVVDHIDPKKKKYMVSDYLTRITSEKAGIGIREELKQCQVLCKKCHDEKSIMERENKLFPGAPPYHGTYRGYYTRKCRCQYCVMYHERRTSQRKKK